MKLGALAKLTIPNANKQELYFFTELSDLMTLETGSLAAQKLCCR